MNSHLVAPSMAQALVEAGLKHHRAGALELAKAHYRQALALEEDNLNALQLLGALASASGHADEAVSLLERAVGLAAARGLAPQHASLFLNCGLALAACERGGDAIVCYRRGLALDAAMPELRAALAAALRKAGDPANAAAEYESAVRLGGERPDWLHNLAGAYAALEAFEKAVACYRRALAAAPARLDTLYALGLALLSLGRPREAVEPLARLAGALPDDPAALSALGSAYHGTREWDAAAACFQRVLAVSRADANAHWMMGSIRHAQARHAEAEAAYREALAHAPDLPGALFNLGLLLHRELDRTTEAVACFERLAATAPDHVEVYAALGNAYRGLGDVDKALAAYRRYLERRPDSPLAHLLVGEGLSEAGQKEAAIPALEAALALDLDASLRHLAEIDIGNVLQDLGRSEEAHRHFRRALALEPLWMRKSIKEKPDFTVLLVMAPGANNTPFEYLVERATYDCGVLLLLPQSAPDRAFLSSRCDLVMNLVSDADQAPAAIGLARALIDELGKPIVNHPDRIGSTGREAVALRLAGIPCCRVARLRRCAGPALLEPDFLARSAAFPLPFLARLIGRHGGDDFEMIESASDLRNLVARHPQSDHYLIEYLDYRSPDGFFRKYRFFFVGEAILPYHLAISASWKVHHADTDMASLPWTQREEEAFLRAPEQVFEARHFQALGAIRAEIGLDFFGIDCALDRDGNLVVFEANASMLVHDRNHAFPYKTPHVRRIKAAFGDMLAKKLTVHN